MGLLDFSETTTISVSLPINPAVYAEETDSNTLLRRLKRKEKPVECLYGTQWRGDWPSQSTPAGTGRRHRRMSVVGNLRIPGARGSGLGEW
jgi:hypothetical protein